MQEKVCWEETKEGHDCKVKVGAWGWSRKLRRRRKIRNWIGQLGSEESNFSKNKACLVLVNSCCKTTSSWRREEIKWRWFFFILTKIWILAKVIFIFRFYLRIKSCHRKRRRIKFSLFKFVLISRTWPTCLRCRLKKKVFWLNHGTTAKR